MKKNSLLKAMLVVFFSYILLSWIIPTGYFNNGEFVKDAVEPIGVFDIIIYPIVTATSSVFILTSIIFLLIGGFYGILNKTGAYSSLLEKIVKKWKGKEKTLLIIIALSFTILASLTGLSLPLFILVPFASAILMLLGYNKITSMLATVGGILAGNMASTYGFNVAGYVSYLTENIHDSILIRVIMLALICIVLIVTLVKTSKITKNVDIPLYEKTVSKENNTKPLVITFILTMIIIFVGMFNWYGVFGIELFDNILEKINSYKIGNYALFGNLLGTLPALGSWTNYELGLVLILNGFVIGLLYGLKLDEIVEAFKNGIKEMVPVALWTMAASLIFLLMNTNENGYTIYSTISNFILGLTKDLNVVTMSLTSFIGSILFNDFPYLLSALYTQVTTIYTNFSLVGMIVQIVHGFIQFFVPTSVVLVAGLTYFEIPYVEWLKKLWKFFLSIFAVGISVLIIMLIIA